MKKTETFFGLLWLLMTVCLSSCSGDSGASSGKLVGKYKPILNPHPKYFVTIKGRIDPSLINKVNPIWSVTYYTTNKQCRYTINQFEGVSSYRRKSLSFLLNPNQQGYFKLKIPLDRFKLGFCHWRPSFLGYNIPKQNLSNGIFVFFSDKKSTKPNKATQTIKCSNVPVCDYVNYASFSKNSYDRENYLIKFNIVRS